MTFTSLDDFLHYYYHNHFLPNLDFFIDQYKDRFSGHVANFRLWLDRHIETCLDTISYRTDFEDLFANVDMLLLLFVLYKTSTILEEVNKEAVRQQAEYIYQDIHKLLLHKNKMYGNSALSPVRIFSKANTYEQLLVRIDDKLSRLNALKVTASIIDQEDTYSDLIGYLLLLLFVKESYGDYEA